MTSIIKVDQIQLTNGNAPTAADLGFASGSVAKVTRLTDNTEVSNTTQSYATVWNTTYTPVLTNSKLLISWTLRIVAYHSSGAEKRFHYRLNLDGSQVFENTYNGIYNYNGDGNWTGFDYVSSIEHTNTTGSAITLQFQTKNEDSNSGVIFNDSAGDTSVITITELVS